MSSATQSTLSSVTLDLHRVKSICIERFVNGLRAVSFWTAALLPLVILAGMITGMASQHTTAVASALALNAICAVLGHSHSPNR